MGTAVERGFGATGELLGRGAAKQGVLHTRLRVRARLSSATVVQISA